MSDEPVDPRIEVEEQCKPQCAKLFSVYTECAERVEQKGEGDCTGQYFDFLRCMDKCVRLQCEIISMIYSLQMAPKLFKRLA